MRIAVVTSTPPLAVGGHLVIARSLVDALRHAGHEAGLVTTPQNRFGRQAAAYLATWLTDVGLGDDDRPIDRVISLRYPSYAVRHPHQVCWLNHTMREYYDLWPAFAGALSWKGRMKERGRRALIRAADRRLLGSRLRGRFAQSRTIQARLLRDLGLPSEVLYPPPPQRPYRCDEYGDHVLVVSRLARHKRVELVIEALARPAAADVRCVVAGGGGDARRLQELIDARGVGARVALIGQVDDAELVDRLARCRAVCFVPLAEDYGFVTVEAFASAKAVVTCRDSGGPTELVRDGEEGFVCDPTPDAVAAALGRLWHDHELAVRLGRAGLRVAGGLSWPSTVERLLA